ncbi:MAG TPA: nuclear transport factor 2 family protein [Terriglobales bacterium]|nr:nuclear transport factor 2 family protein [Terriglobales bacterium]
MRAAWASLILIAAATLSAECTQHDAKSQEGLLVIENRWVKALDNRDQAALACILGAEFKDAGVYGQVRDRAQVLSELPNRRDAGQHLQDLDTIVLGDTGVVRGVNHLTAPDGKPLVDVRFTDVFVYREGRWQAVSAQETLVRKEK